MPLTKQTLLLLALSTTVRADVNHDFHECCSTGWSMIPMEWFLLNVDVVGEEDTVNFYEDETQGGLVTVRTASITRDGPGGRIQELGVPGCGTFAFEYGSDGKLVDYTYDGDEAWDSCVPDGSSLTPPTVKPTAEPTVKPTVKPTARPTPRPTIKPTAKPTTKQFPTCGVGRGILLRGGGEPRRGGGDLPGALRYLNGHYPHSPLLALEPSLVVTLEPEEIY